MKTGAFLDEYSAEATAMLETAAGRKLTESEINTLSKTIQGVEDTQIELSNTYTETERTCSLLSVLDRLREVKPIITGNGTLFNREGAGGHNVAGGFVKSLLDTRKACKKRMFEVQDKAKGKKGNDKKVLDQQKEVLDMRQKVFKVLVNAYYGSIGMPAFIFYDPNSAPAVTGTGMNVVTSLVQSFEQFLDDNWAFECWGDVFEFVQASLDKDSSYEIELSTDINVSDIHERLTRKLPEGLHPSEGEEILSQMSARLQTLLESLDDDQLARLYYRNNLYAFLVESDVSDLLVEILGYDIPSGNPGEVDDPTLKKNLDTLWAVVNDYVVLLTFHQDRMDFCEHSEKRSVLVVDTDSTFLLMDTFVKWVVDTYDIGELDPNRRISLCNIVVFMMAGYSDIILEDYARRTNIEASEHLDLKNEFIFSRIMLTPNKKSYAGSIMSREGKLLSPPKFEITGLKIKTINVNKKTREYFKRVLKDKIVECKEIDIQDLLGEFVAYEVMVAESIENGELVFAQPTKYSGFSFYKEPYRQAVVRGTVVWNDIYPETPIQALDNVRMLKCAGISEGDFDAIVTNLKKEDAKIAARVRDLVFENEKTAHHGFSRVCLPRSVKEIPSWVKPFVDVEMIVHDNVRNALILLESVGIVVLDARNRSRYSNIVRF